MYRSLHYNDFFGWAFSYARDYVVRYPAPINLGYWWNVGSMSAIFFGSQIITGIMLAMFYVPHTDIAFFSVDHIMRDISYGWFLRYLHANGASFFFFFVYIHIVRGLYFNSYKFPRTHIWTSGAIIYLLLMATAFLGYVLPWGQMSFWAATVITNFITVIPFVGEDLVFWVWGGYSINNATLNRFFCLHYLLPFIIAFFVLFHLFMLHQVSSSNELAISSDFSHSNKIAFFPYFIIKDGLSFFYMFFFFIFVVCFFPEVFNHSVNYIFANILVTPSHIVPEWYFLPFYAILRSILNKTIGIIAMILSVAIFLFLPILDFGVGIQKVHIYSYRIVFWLLIIFLLMLGFLGSNTAEFPCVEFGIANTILFFNFIIFVIPYIEFTNSIIGYSINYKI